MKWMKPGALPNDPGFYWYRQVIDERRQKYRAPWIVAVSRKANGTLIGELLGAKGGEAVSGLTGQWAGPIEQPSE